MDIILSAYEEHTFLFTIFSLSLTFWILSNLTKLFVPLVLISCIIISSLYFTLDKSEQLELNKKTKEFISNFDTKEISEVSETITKPFNTASKEISNISKEFEKVSKQLNTILKEQP